MKYIKTYENLSDKPQIGDYVMVDSSQFIELDNFFNSEIGKIDSINEREILNGYPYYVKFKNKIPGSTYGPSGDYQMAFKEKELFAWGSSLEDLNLKIKAKKYNL